MAGTPCEFSVFPFGEDEVYDLNLGGATGGTFKLTNGGVKTTAAIDYDATAGEIQSELATAYDEENIIVGANATGFVISFPTGVKANLTLNATSPQAQQGPRWRFVMSWLSTLAQDMSQVSPVPVRPRTLLE